MADNMPTSINLGKTAHIERGMTMRIMSVAFIFAFLAMAPRSSQSVMTGPSCLWFSSQALAFGLDLAKQPADRSTKGVVGNKGKKIPTMPKAKLAHPMLPQTCFKGSLPLCPVSERIVK